MRWGFESMHLLLEVSSPWPNGNQYRSNQTWSSRRLQPLARGRGLLERRVAPVPQGQVLTAKDLEGVTAEVNRLASEVSSIDNKLATASAQNNASLTSSIMSAIASRFQPGGPVAVLGKRDGPYGPAHGDEQVSAAGSVHR